MTPPPVEWLSWADLCAKAGQFLFGLATLALTLWAAAFKRKDLFRTELAKRQLDELGRIRESLQSIFFDFYCVPFIEQAISAMGCSLESLKQNDPESWDQCQRYTKTSLDLFYKFSDANYYLFPDWIEKERCTNFSEAMRRFAPFTLRATTSKNQAERDDYLLEISKMKNYLDRALKKHA